jgi:uncharacterized membrane protein
VDGLTGGDEDGSVLLLTIGYALLAIALVLVCVDATSLYLAQKRVDAAADAVAIAAADGFRLTVADGRAVAALSSEDVREQADAMVDAIGTVQLVDADTDDGASARVTVATIWRPPVMSLFVPDGVEITASATSRTAVG